MAARAYPTLVVPLELLAQQAIAQLSQLAQAGKTADATFRNLSSVMRTTTSQLAQTGETARNIGSGIGGFFIMSRALSLSTRMLHGGVEAAMDYELAITNLGIKLRTTAAQSEALGRLAQKAALKVGPLDVVDVVHAQGQLANLAGSTANRIGALTDPFASFVSNIVELSEHAFNADAVGQYTAQILNLFGGIEDVNKAMTTLEALHGAIAGRASRQLPQLIQALRPIVIPLTAKGMSIKDIITLGVWGTVFPQSTRGGRDIRQFFDEVSNVNLLAHKKGGLAKERLGALHTLGITDTAGQSVLYDPVTGKADPARLARSMSAALGQMQAREGTRYNEVLSNTFGQAFGSQLARGFGQLFGAEGIQRLGELGEVVATANDIKGTLELLQKTSKVSLDRLMTDVKTIATVVFKAPSTVLGRAANVGANALEVLYQDLIAHPAAAPAAFGGLGLGGVGVGSKILGMMFKGAGRMGVGGGLTSAVGTGLGAVGEVALWGSTLSLVVLGGIELYQHSEGFRSAVQAIKDTFLGIFDPEEISDLLQGAWKEVKNSVLGTGADNFFTPYHPGMYGANVGLYKGSVAQLGMTSLGEAAAQLGMSLLDPNGMSTFRRNDKKPTPDPFVPPPDSLGAPEPPAAHPVAQHEKSRAKSDREQVSRFKDMHDMMEGVFSRMQEMTQPHLAVQRQR